MGVDRSVPEEPPAPESTRWIPWLTLQEVERLLAELPTYLAAMARFSLSTGLRERNTTRLEWSQVDLERRVAWIHPAQAKAKKPLAMPLNDEAAAVLEGEAGKHATRVFSSHGQPIDKANTHAWRKALKRAGIVSFRWHDFAAHLGLLARATGHSVTRVAGARGWSCYAIVQCCAHLSAEHLAAYAGNVTRIRAENRILLGTSEALEKECA